jgi:hypothetical protein
MATTGRDAPTVPARSLFTHPAIPKTKAAAKAVYIIEDLLIFIVTVVYHIGLSLSTGFL